MAMRFLLSTLGTDGDVEPFLALAQRLVAAGHSVKLATNERFEQRAAGLAIPFTSVGPPWDPAFAEAMGKRALAVRNPMRQVTQIINVLAELQHSAMPQLEPLVRDADVVVCSTLAVASIALARALGKKHISVQLQALQRSRNESPGTINLGALANRALWPLAASLVRRQTDAQLNRCVQAAGLAPWRDILFVAAHSELLDLVAVSPHVQPHDPWWSSRTRVTGYWFVEEHAWQPDPALEALVGDQAPIVIGFGSMMGYDRQAVNRCIAEAVKDLGRPVVLQAGWGELGGADLPSHVHVVGFVPHSWLFARAACVVHHGGAGTSAAGLRSGVPQAVVWHFGDQPFWGRKLAALGVAPKPRSHHDLNPRWLRGAIERMLNDARMRERAAALGAKIRAEDGVGVAARAIEAAL